MRFKCARNDLVESFQITQKAVSPRSTLPILTGILLDFEEDKLTLTATDLEISIQNKLNVKVEDKGSLVVPARLVSDIIRNLPEAVVQVESVSDGRIVIICEQAKFEIKVLILEDYPKFPEITDGSSIEVDVKTFKDAVKQVIKAVSRDETRPILTGVLISFNKDHIKMVATDSYRLAVREIKTSVDIEEKIKIIIPARALDELSKILPDANEKLKITVNENQIIFQHKNTTFASRLIEGQFPNYQQLLPEEQENKLEIKKQVFIDAVKRVSLLAQNNTPIRLVASGQKMKIHAVNQEVGEASEEIGLLSGGGESEIAFNAQFLLDGLASLEEETVVLELTSNVKPGLIKPKEGKDFLYLIMPMRV